MGACKICSRDGQIKGLGTEIPQRGPGMDLGGSLGALTPEADNRLWE